MYLLGEHGFTLGGQDNAALPGYISYYLAGLTGIGRPMDPGSGRLGVAFKGFEMAG
jgi:hypothetical protein